MNEKNYDYLKNQVKFMGFGEELNSELLKNIQEQPKEFQLQHQTKFGQDEISSTLNFEKSKQSDMYFFQNFEMAIKSPGQEDALKQTFYVGKEHNITLKEHHNMLQGRSVYKTFPKLEEVTDNGTTRFKPTGETYQAWANTNFKETEADGTFKTRKMFGYNLEKALDKFPIKELEDNYDKRRLIASMEKGNLVKATVTVNGEEKKVLVAANPKDNSVNFYDENSQRIEVRQVAAQKASQTITEKPGENNDLKQQGNAISAQDQTGDTNQAQKSVETVNGQFNKDNQQKEQAGEKQDEQKAGHKRKQGVKI